MIAETHKELKLSRNTIYNWIYRGMIPGVSEDNLRYQKRFKRRKSTRLLEMSAKERQAEELKIQERRVKQQEKRVIRPIKHSIEERSPAVNSRRLFGHWEV